VNCLRLPRRGVSGDKDIGGNTSLSLGDSSSGEEEEKVITSDVGEHFLDDSPSFVQRHPTTVRHIPR
jgi:hypothetical protein